jgi:hypothetical protein
MGMIDNWRVRIRYRRISVPSEMTSVLYSSGLNYQASNPLRLELARIKTDITELRVLAATQTTEIGLLKAQLAVANKSIAAVTTGTPVVNASTANTVTNVLASSQPTQTTG